MKHRLEAELKTSFDKNGYVHIPGFLKKSLLDELKHAVEKYIIEKVPNLESADAFYDDPDKPETLKQLHRMHQDPFFEKYRHNSKWLETAELLLCQPVESAIGVELFNKPPNTKHETPPHQDNYYFCFEPPHVLTIWVALDSVDEFNGCMRYVSGSHVNGLRPHKRSSILGFSQSISDFGVSDLENEEVISAKPGDALVHHGNTIHRAEPNQTCDRYRRGFAMVIKGTQAKRNIDKYKSYCESSTIQQSKLGVEPNF